MRYIEFQNKELLIQTFENISLLNTCNHNINIFSEKTGNQYILFPSGFVCNAEFSSEQINSKQYKNMKELMFYLKKIYKNIKTEKFLNAFHEKYPDTVIIGSQDAAKAYKGLVCNGKPSRNKILAGRTEFKEILLHEYTIY